MNEDCSVQKHHRDILSTYMTWSFLLQYELFEELRFSILCIVLGKKLELQLKQTEKPVRNLLMVKPVTVFSFNLFYF